MMRLKKIAMKLNCYVYCRTYYYMTYKPSLQPQYVTKYKCCDGWSQVGASLGCVYSKYTSLNI